MSYILFFPQMIHIQLKLETERLNLKHKNLKKQKKTQKGMLVASYSLLLKTKTFTWFTKAMGIL